MTTRSLVTHPDPILRKCAEPVAQIDGSVRALVGEMSRIMAEEEGLGLAAPQAGAQLRLFITQDARKGATGNLVFINPHFILVDGPLVGAEEGCLSLPGIRATIRRQSHAIIEAQDIDGNTFTLEDDGLMARCWQHEMDHLEGIMIIDRMTVMDRLVNRKQLRALESSEAIG